MKKIFIWIILFICLLILTIYFILEHTYVTYEQDLRDFAIEDTASVSKIFIAEADGKTVLLTRTEQNHWLINNKRRARQDAIDNILITAKKIAVKYPVSEKARNNVIKLLAGKSTKVEFYDKRGRLLKTYYVGNATQDLSGTYMLLEINGKKSSVPFVTHIPGFHGFLNTRFFADTAIWQHRAIFTYSPEQIAEIEVINHTQPDQSFRIVWNSQQLRVEDYAHHPVKDFDTSKVVSYLHHYKSVYFEQVDNISPRERIDSVLKTPPLFTIRLKTTDNKVTRVSTYRMPNFKRVLDGSGNPYPYDVDRMYAQVVTPEGYVDFVFVQYVTFDLIQIPLKDLLIKKK